MSMMKAHFILSFFFLFSLFLSSIEADSWAYCRLEGTQNDPQVTGFVRFHQKSGNSTVEMHVEASGITVNPDDLHGIHIHQFGDISEGNGLNTGSHFNPDQKNHGCPNLTRHIGDTGNWKAISGVINSTTVFDLLTLNGVKSIVGRAVIIHAKEDDCLTNPTGDAGSRLAQCVIGISNEENNEAMNEDTSTNKAICVLKGTSGNENIRGIVYLDQEENGVNIIAEIEGLEVGSKHGFHIHEFGDLSVSTGSSLGGHYNPFNRPHGIPPLTSRHVGDLGNIYYFNESNGIAMYKYLENELVSINRDPENVIGRGFVVHALQDDCTGLSGNAGSRIAACVIGIRSSSRPFFTHIPSEQDVSLCPTQATTGTTETTNGDKTSEGGQGSSAGTILGVMVILVLVVVIGVTVYWYLRKQKKKSEMQEFEMNQNQDRSTQDENNFTSLDTDDEVQSFKLR